MRKSCPTIVRQAVRLADECDFAWAALPAGSAPETVRAFVSCHKRAKLAAARASHGFCEAASVHLQAARADARTAQRAHRAVRFGLHGLGHNDFERGRWVDNDEGLYRKWRASGLSQREYIRRNRAMLDDIIDNVESGRKKAHYLLDTWKHLDGLHGAGSVPRKADELATPMIKAMADFEAGRIDATTRRRRLAAAMARIDAAPFAVQSLVMDRLESVAQRRTLNGLGRNDAERAEWVDNDEGLYRQKRASGLSMRAFVQQNRARIDELIDNVTSGRRKSHYLVYEDWRHLDGLGAGKHPKTPVRRRDQDLRLRVDADNRKILQLSNAFKELWRSWDAGKIDGVTYDRRMDVLWSQVEASNKTVREYVLSNLYPRKARRNATSVRR